jgi:hypothetical protein
LDLKVSPVSLANPTVASTSVKVFRLENHCRLACSFPTFGSHRTAETVASPIIRTADIFDRTGIPRTFVTALHFHSAHEFEY